jgi:hypothetical protein
VVVGKGNLETGRGIPLGGRVAILGGLSMLASLFSMQSERLVQLGRGPGEEQSHTSEKPNDVRAESRM